MRAGSYLPIWYGLNQEDNFFSSEDQIGVPALLCFVGSRSFAEVEKFCHFLRNKSAFLKEQGARLIVMVNLNNQDRGRYNTFFDGSPTMVLGLDKNPDFFSNHDVLLTDRANRVVQAVSIDDSNLAGCFDALINALRATQAHAERDAPVIFSPNVFDRSFCQTLMHEFENSVQTVGGMASVDKNGNAVFKVDKNKKIRTDFLVEDSNRLKSSIIDCIVDICLPDLKKAFNFEAAFVDRILISRYDSSGGYFRRHRDNNAPATKFRQFALSVNLNSEDFEGGQLGFPEYNDRKYKPETGCGVIFSASLLHEAMDVTRGSRYCLLTFLQGKPAALEAGGV